MARYGYSYTPGKNTTDPDAEYRAGRAKFGRKIAKIERQRREEAIRKQRLAIQKEREKVRGQLGSAISTMKSKRLSKKYQPAQFARIKQLEGAKDQLVGLDDFAWMNKAEKILEPLQVKSKRRSIRQSQPRKKKK